MVERANRILGEGIKARLDKRSKDWMDEVSYVLWAHRTMIKSSNGDTPFSLTYGTKAVIPAEIGMPTLCTKRSIDLGEYDIQYRPIISIKGQILADFIVERPKDDSLVAPMEVEEELLDPWTLFTDGSSYIDGSGARLILTIPE
ncbi:reverse transcriptase domain-containing protein [Tanacetum coccineum]|uniref:Reverse transcriptase domain-containing protein n=1 Tax=Tanacetum coccineum TaxID=301880 RepID=A0ABQ4ZGD8_9ASTR